MKQKEVPNRVVCHPTTSTKSQQSKGSRRSREELRAVVQMAEADLQGKKCIIITDSQYVVQTVKAMREITYSIEAIR